MRGASRASLSGVKERLSGILAGGQAGQANELGGELFSVVGLLDGEPGLRRALSDPSRDQQARAGLAEALLAGQALHPGHGAADSPGHRPLVGARRPG